MTTEEKNEPVKKKRGPKKGTKQPKSEATQFKPGQSGNPLGAKLNFRKPTIDMRTRMHELITQAAMPMLVNLLYDSYEQKDRKDMLDIIKFMYSYAYGTPREIRDYEELDQADKPNNQSVIMISRDDLMRQIDSDKDYE